jgi:hypothetical protein
MIPNVTSPLKKFSKYFLALIGIVSQANTFSQFTKLKPWVYDIRGHYTAHELSTETILEVLTALDTTGLCKIEPANSSNHEIRLQYRLGVSLH